MKTKRMLILIEEKIKRSMKDNEAKFEVFNHEILKDIEEKNIEELTDIIYKQSENIEKYKKAMKSLRMQLKIVDSLKKYVKE